MSPSRSTLRWLRGALSNLKARYRAHCDTVRCLAEVERDNHALRHVVDTYHLQQGPLLLEVARLQKALAIAEGKV
jgi:hypothetical protein